MKLNPKQYTLFSIMIAAFSAFITTRFFSDRLLFVYTVPIVLFLTTALVAPVVVYRKLKIEILIS